MFGEQNDYFNLAAMELAHWIREYNFDVNDVDLLSKLGRYKDTKKYFVMEKREFAAIRSTLITNIDPINDLIEKRNSKYATN